MSNDELLTIHGGADLPSTLINALVRLVDITLEVGRAFGSAIRRLKDGDLC